MAKENPTVVLLRNHVNEENNIKLIAYKNDADETCYRVSGFCRGNFFALEWHQDEEKPLEESHDYYKMKEMQINSYR